MYEKGVPSAPTPSRKEKATLHASLAAPPSGKVAHVDLFLSSVRPYWPNEKKIRADDAGMGPIVNSAGLYLTAVNYQVSSTAEPDPFGDVSDGEPIDQCVRGIGERLDPSGFLWICEKMIPRTKVGSTSPPRPSGAPPEATPTSLIAVPHREPQPRQFRGQSVDARRGVRCWLPLGLETSTARRSPAVFPVYPVRRGATRAVDLHFPHRINRRYPHKPADAFVRIEKGHAAQRI